MVANKKITEGVSKLEKVFGKGIVMNLEDDGIKMPRTSSGSLTLDIALGGGMPDARIIEMYGAASAGKTTVALHTIAEYQKNGHLCAFIDAEMAYDKTYASILGVNNSELLFSQPDCGEDVFTVAETLILTGEIRCIVIDSVAAMIPKAELEGDYGDSKMGLHARLMSQGMRKITAIAKKNNCTLIFINQTREKIGIVYGINEVTTGGKSLEFYASVRCRVSKSKGADEEGERATSVVKVEVVKNKTAPPYRKAQFDIRFGEGIDKAGEIVDLATELELLNKSGSWYSYNGDKLGQGRAAIVQMLKDNPEFSNELEVKIREHYGL
jgi:recombination protein RecA